MRERRDVIKNFLRTIGNDVIWCVQKWRCSEMNRGENRRATKTHIQRDLILEQKGRRERDSFLCISIWLSTAWTCAFRTISLVRITFRKCSALLCELWIGSGIHCSSSNDSIGSFTYAMFSAVGRVCVRVCVWQHCSNQTRNHCPRFAYWLAMGIQLVRVHSARVSLLLLSERTYARKRTWCFGSAAHSLFHSSW